MNEHLRQQHEQIIKEQEESVAVKREALRRGVAVATELAKAEQRLAELRKAHQFFDKYP